MKDVLIKLLRMAYPEEGLVGHYYDKDRDHYHMFNYMWCLDSIFIDGEYQKRKRRLIAEIIYDNKMKVVGRHSHFAMDMDNIV